MQKIILLIFAVAVGMFALFDLNTYGGNVLGRIWFWGCLCGAGAGLIYPKPALMGMLLIAPYMDFFKRLLILGGGVTYTDLYYILGFPIIVMFFICVSVSFSMMNNRSLGRTSLRMIVATFLACGVIGLYSHLAIEATQSGIAAIGSSIAFIPLLVIIPYLFPDPSENKKLMKLIIFGWLPVFLYAIYQKWNGLADYEYDYLLVGPTNQGSRLVDLVFPYFSTLNSGHALGIVGSFCIVLHFYWRSSKSGQITAKTLIFSGIYIILGLSAIWIGRNRSGVLALLLGLAAYPALRSYLALRLSIIGGGLVLACAFLFPRSIYDYLNSNPLLGKFTSDEHRVLQTATFKERLTGFITLQEDKDFLQPLGMHVAGTADKIQHKFYGDFGFSHDAISTFIFHFGYIPFVLFLVGGVAVAIKIQSIILKNLDKRNRNFILSLLAGFICIASNSTTNQNVFGHYPMNLMMWLVVAIVLNMLSSRSANIINQRL